MILFYILRQFLIEGSRKIQRNVFGVQPTTPWMKQREIDLMKHILNIRKPDRVLEWGSGYGTVEFPKAIDSIEWIAIEHDKEWSEQIANKLDPKKSSIRFVPPEEPDWYERDHDGTLEDFKNYIEEPSKLGKFDLVIVDGRARTECLEVASGILEENGIVFLHDANRERYLKYAGLFPHFKWLTDYRSDAGGVWLGSRSPMNDLDLEFFAAMFEYYKTSKLVSSLNL